MAGSGVSAGHETRVYYYWEDGGFAAAPADSTEKTFGADITVNTTEGSNAIQRVFRPGKRVGVDQLAMVFDGSWSVQFTLVNPWWIRTLLGSPSQTANDTDGDGATDSYTYDYTGTSPETIQIVEGHEQSGKQRVLKGCFATRATIDTSVEQGAEVTLEGAYVDEELQSNAMTAQPTATDTYDPLTFAEGSIALGGTTEKYVQNMSLTIEANADPIREMGTRKAVDFNPKVLAPSVNFGKLFDGDHDSLASLFGGSAATSVQEDADDNMVMVDMKFDNGKADGSGINTATFSISGTLADTYGEDGMGDPRADLQETVNRSGLDVDASWTNEEAAEP